MTADLAEAIRDYLDESYAPTDVDAIIAAAASRRRGVRQLRLVAALAVSAAAVVVALVLAGGPAPRHTAATRAPLGTAEAEPSAAVPADAAGQPVVISGARTDDTGVQLVVRFDGAASGNRPCQALYSGTAVDAGDVVHVTVSAAGGAPLEPGRACAALGYSHTMIIDLPTPLAGRPVIDTATGSQLFVTEGATLLRPDVLPAGWGLLAEGPAGRSSPDSGSWWRQYGADQHETISVVQSSVADPTLGTSDGYHLERHVDINGTDAGLYRDESGNPELVWAPGDWQVSVSGTAVDANALIDFARLLH